MAEPLTRAFLLSQGACCGSICRNCPYVPRHVAGATWVDASRTPEPTGRDDTPDDAA